MRVGGRGGGAIATCTRWSWRGTACCAWARPPHLVAATALTPPASPPSARSTGRPCAACRSCAGATRGGAGLLVGEPGRRARSLGAGGRRGLWGREAGRDRWTWATLIPILASALGGIFVGQVAFPPPCSRRSAWQASEPPTQPPPREMVSNTSRSVTCFLMSDSDTTVVILSDSDAAVRLGRACR